MTMASISQGHRKPGLKTLEEPNKEIPDEGALIGLLACNMKTIRKRKYDQLGPNQKN